MRPSGLTHKGFRECPSEVFTLTPKAWMQIAGDGSGPLTFSFDTWDQRFRAGPVFDR
jgi:hypothetical protein